MQYLFSHRQVWVKYLHDDDRSTEEFLLCLTREMVFESHLTAITDGTIDHSVTSWNANETKRLQLKNSQQFMSTGGLEKSPVELFLCKFSSVFGISCSNSWRFDRMIFKWVSLCDTIKTGRRYRDDIDLMYFSTKTAVRLIEFYRSISWCDSWQCVSLCVCGVQEPISTFCIVFFFLIF